MNRLNGLRGTDEKFRAFGLTADSLGSDDVLVRSKATDASAVYSSDAAQLLFACADFESLAGHASAEIKKRRRQLQHGGARSWQDRLFASVLRLAERSDVHIPVQSGELEPVIRQLREFAEQGFLCSERQLRKRLAQACQSGGGDESRGSITAVGIPTCERPRHLERALTSYVSSLREVGRSTSILVVDDSDDRQSRKENRSIAERMNDGYDGSVQYLGRRAREDLLRRMGNETDIPSEVITFALQGSEIHSMTYGAAVNTVLLTTAGKKIFLSDDDMLCRSAVSPGRQKGLGLSSRSPYEYRFFKNRTAAVEAVDFVTEDVLGRHEQLLGRSAACAMLSHGIGSSDFDISGLDYSLLTDLEWHDPSIVLTFPGLVGESGSSDNLHRLLTENEETFERLVCGPIGYRAALRTHQLVKSVRRRMISSHDYCMSGAMGIDNRRMIPPFMPLARNCDGTFGCVLDVCSNSAFRGHLPHVLLHDPPRTRLDPLSVREVELGPRLNDLLQWMIADRSTASSGRSSRREMKDLGEVLVGVADMPARMFEEYIRELAAGVGASRARRAVSRLDAAGPDAPGAWREDVRELIGAYRQQLTADTHHVPVDLQGEADERMRQFQKVVRLYGQLLFHWPEMHFVARQMKGLAAREL